MLCICKFEFDNKINKMHSFIHSKLSYNPTRADAKSGNVGLSKSN